MPISQEQQFYVMINHEQSAGLYPNIELARLEGQRMCDAEPIPSTWSIADADGNEVEKIERSDGRTLSDQIAAFNRLHSKQKG